MSISSNGLESMPNHEIGEEERFETDFYDYLDSPENRSRYEVAIDALSRLRPNESLTILDVGCGHANIANSISDRISYIGIDHSEVAIEACRKNFPNQTFVVGDALNYLNSSDPVDAIVCCGFLFHNVDKNTLTRNDDNVLVNQCLASLKKDGLLIIISPFAYSDAEGYEMFDQASWKLKNMELVLDGCNGEKVWQSMVLQLGAGDRAKNQNHVPDWWTPPTRDGNTNRYSGTYLGSWTVMLSPKE